MQVASPLEYLKKYFDDTFFENAADCTNRYKFLQKGENLKTSAGEMKIFFGMHIAMGCVRFPRFRMYWQNKFKIPIVAETMCRDRFFKLREALHVVVQNDVTEAEKKANVFWKVQPIIDSVRNACLKIPREENGQYSIDEQMIPFTGRCPVRQSLPGKPRGVGLKNEVLTTSKGLVLDFEIYQGKTTPLPEENIGLGSAFVLRLVVTLPKGSTVFFDRYFTTYYTYILEKLLEIGIFGTGTIMRNRIKGVNLTEDKKMKRGDMEEFCCPEDKVVIVQWKDSKSVLLASSAFGCSPVNDVRRWCKKENKFIVVAQPNTVRQYNESMGGVDICDQQMEAYRCFFKTRKWPLKVIIHFIDLACCNAWMEYRNDCRKIGKPAKDTHDLLSFRLALAEALVAIPKTNNVEWSSESEKDEAETPPQPKRYRPADQPCPEKRMDCFNHWPEELDLKSARMCRRKDCKSRTRTRCTKCDVFLCFSKKNNCFKLHHTEK